MNGYRLTVPPRVRSRKANSRKVFGALFIIVPVHVQHASGKALYFLSSGSERIMEKYYQSNYDCISDLYCTASQGTKQSSSSVDGDKNGNSFNRRPVGLSQVLECRTQQGRSKALTLVECQHHFFRLCKDSNCFFSPLLYYILTTEKWAQHRAVVTTNFFRSGSSSSSSGPSFSCGLEIERLPSPPTW